MTTTTAMTHTARYLSLTEDRLAKLLRMAAKAHHEYEASLGHADENWPVWYAQYMLENSVALDAPKPQSVDEDTLGMFGYF